MVRQFIFLLGFAVFVGASDAYADCILSSRDTGARAQIGTDPPIDLKPGRPVFAPGCNVTVLSGNVRCLHEDPTLSQPCRSVVRSPSGADRSGLVALLGGFLRGDVRQRLAGKRLSDAEDIPGFPSGEVLMPAKDMLIPLVWVKDGPVTAFVLEDPVARTRNSMPIEASAIRVAHRHLAVGRTYKWQATIGGQNRTGSFTTVRPGEQVDLNEQLKQIAANPDYAADPAARAVARAMVLYGEHFAFDALQEISGFVQRQ